MIKTYLHAKKPTLIYNADIDHHNPEKAFLKASGCASCSKLYMHKDEAIIRTKIIRIEEKSCIFFSDNTFTITLKASYFVLILNSLSTRNILNTLNTIAPLGKTNGMKYGKKVSKSIIPKNENINVIMADSSFFSGYKYLAVHILNPYSMANKIEVTNSSVLIIS